MAAKHERKRRMVKLWCSMPTLWGTDRWNGHEPFFSGSPLRYATIEKRGDAFGAGRSSLCDFWQRMNQVVDAHEGFTVRLACDRGSGNDDATTRGSMASRQIARDRRLVYLPEHGRDQCAGLNLHPVRKILQSRV